MLAIIKHSQLTKNNQNQQYIIHKFRVNYQQKLYRLDSLHPYEFSKKIKKINIYYNNFWNAQLQSNTHNLYEYKVLKMLVMQSYTIPSQKNDLDCLNITHHWTNRNRVYLLYNTSIINTYIIEITKHFEIMES
jgi:hypothetical protein